MSQYTITLRRNGRDTGAIGPYAHKADAERDAREIVIRLSGDAEATVQRVTVGSTKYKPAPSTTSPEPEWKKHAKHETMAPPKSGGGFTWGPAPTGASAPKPPKASKSSLFADEPSMAETWQPWKGDKHGGPPDKPYVAPPPREAYGTVIINDAGQVLLREPSNHYDGYTWTFPKGGQDKGETGEATALRETVEETGWTVELVNLLPGEWKGGTTLNRYFLARPVSTSGMTDKETWNVEFVPYVEAVKRIAQSDNSKGRVRDLAVLDAGYAEWTKLTGKPAYNPRRPLNR